MLHKKYVTLTLHDIFSLPKIDHFESYHLEIICMLLLFAIGKAEEIIMNNFKIQIFFKKCSLSYIELTLHIFLCSFLHYFLKIFLWEGSSAKKTTLHRSTYKISILI